MRGSVLDRLADLIASRRTGPTFRVAIHGPGRAGKSTLAAELVPLLAARGVPVARGSTDDFVRPQEERYARGRDSALGYYYDSFDHDALRASVLAVTGAVVLFDGVFLFRPELDDLWDLRVLVEIDPKESVRRGAGGDRTLATRYRNRYAGGQRLYRQQVQPQSRADAVLQNDDPAHPWLVVR